LFTAATLGCVLRVFRPLSVDVVAAVRVMYVGPTVIQAILENMVRFTAVHLQVSPQSYITSSDFEPISTVETVGQLLVVIKAADKVTE